MYLRLQEIPNSNSTDSSGLGLFRRGTGVAMQPTTHVTSRLPRLCDSVAQQYL